MEVELGVPVAGEFTGAGRVRPGVVPGGRYVTLLHTGPYDGPDGGQRGPPGLGRAAGHHAGQLAGSPQLAGPGRGLLPDRPVGRARPGSTGRPRVALFLISE